MPASMKTAKPIRLLTAQEAARRHGVTPERWIEIAADEPIPPLFNGPEPQWAEWQVPGRKHKRPAPAPAKPRPALPSSTFPDGLWTLVQAARHAGLAPNTLRTYISAGTAPGPVARRRGRHPVFDPADIRAYALSRNPNATPPPEPDSPLWTARQCADHHGISTRTWHAAIAHGDAPEPVETHTRTPMWSAMAVRSAPLE